MKQKQTLAERLKAKLQTLGLTERKAKTLAKGLAPTVARTTVSGTVTEKLTIRLYKLGLSKRQAGDLAKKLAPLVRTAIKTKAKVQAIPLSEMTDGLVNDTVAEVTDAAEDAALDTVAPRVNGHRVRLDLPVVGVHGVKGIEILRVMDGLSSSRSYLVAAVKSDAGIVAVRQFDRDSYKVKFYPTMAYWSKTYEELASLGATSYLDRRGQDLYERVMVNRHTLDQILRRLEAEAKPTSRVKALLKRFTAITATPLIKAFDYLHKRVGKAA